MMDVILRSGEYLTKKGVENGRLNAEHLLAHVLRVERLQLYLDFDRPLGADELDRLRPLLRMRAARQPLQYLLGTAQFRDLELAIDRRVAIPRPETEYLIDVLGQVAGRDRVFDAALDVGTGSGAIALTLAAEGLARAVVATDVSAAALDVDRRCRRSRGGRVPVRGFARTGRGRNLRSGSVEPALSHGKRVAPDRARGA